MNTNTKTSALLSVMMLVLAKVPNVYSGDILHANVSPQKTDVRIVLLDKDDLVTPGIEKESTSHLNADARASTLDEKEEIFSTVTSDRIYFREESTITSSDQVQFESTVNIAYSEKPDGKDLAHRKHDRKSHSHHKDDRKTLSHHEVNDKVVSLDNEVHTYDDIVKELQDGGEYVTPISKRSQWDTGKDMNEFNFAINKPFTTMKIPKFSLNPNYQFDYNGFVKNLQKQQHYDHEMDDILGDRTDNFAIIFMNVAQKILRIMILVCAIGAVVTLCRKKGCCKKKKTEGDSEATPTQWQNGPQHGDQERLINEV